VKVKTKASIHINAPQEKVWDYISNLENLPKYFFGWGPIPAVKKVEIIGKKEMALGLKQRTTTAAGTVLEETVLHAKNPQYFDYEIKGFGFPFNLFVKKGGGSWTFATDDGGTTATWNYFFLLTSPLAYPIAAPLVKLAHQHAMALSLGRAKKQIENLKD